MEPLSTCHYTESTTVMQLRSYRPTPIAIATAVLATASILVVNFLAQPLHLQVWIPRLAVGIGAAIVLLLFNVGFAGLIRTLASRDGGFHE